MDKYSHFLQRPSAFSREMNRYQILAQMQRTKLEDRVVEEVTAKFFFTKGEKIMITPWKGKKLSHKELFWEFFSDDGIRIIDQRPGLCHPRRNTVTVHSKYLTADDPEGVMPVFAIFVQQFTGVFLGYSGALHFKSVMDADSDTWLGPWQPLEHSICLYWDAKIFNDDLSGEAKFDAAGMDTAVKIHKLYQSPTEVNWEARTPRKLNPLEVSQYHSR